MKIEYELMDKFIKLIALNARKDTRFIQEKNPTGLTDMQAVTLQYIMVESKKRDVFARDLEYYFNIKPSSASSLVAYLENAGFIVREPLPGDRRHLKLIVTDKGWEIEDWLMKAIDDSIISGFKGMTSDELDQLLALFRKLEASFRAAAES